MFDQKVMKMTSFAELTNQVHLINDLILSDMICEDVDTSADAVSFSKHLLATKYWFARISWANKKRYLLALLQDVRSVWALSLLLKSMWNCRPKDAVLSVSEPTLYSSYDQVPMDHNRTALPVATLAQVMKNDRLWFLSLSPESQALVLSELLTVAGGPVMWEVLRRARHLYERYREQMLQDLQESTVVNELQQPAIKKDLSSRKTSIGSAGPESARSTSIPGEAHKTLEVNLAAWNATIKGMRDSLKLEEVEMTFLNGTKRKVWKVNRPKPDLIETVDFVQQLPSHIGKKILAYLPYAQLGDYARVNKYWAFLVDELRIELAARTKINAELEKLQDILLRHETSLELYMSPNEIQAGTISWHSKVSAKQRQPLPSTKASEKSAGAYSMRHFIGDKLNRPWIAQKPIRNLRELNERMECRGAADENIWKWCELVLDHAKKIKQCTEKAEDEDGVLTLGNVYFPCPFMKMTMELPLVPPLYRDPTMSTSAKPRRNISECNFIHTPKEIIKRYSLWTRDLSTLYPVLKIPSYLY